MDRDVLITLIALGFILIIIFGGISACFIQDKIDKNYELKKIDILKTNSKKSKIENNYNVKLVYQLKLWIINIIAVLFICIICKLFNFSVSDITDLIKQ